jgi:uncharacterized Tic20 family protein
MNTTSSLALRPSLRSSVGRPDKAAALVAHAGTLFGWFLVPLIVYFVKRNDSKYAEFHALQSLLWSLAGTVVSVLTFGIAIPIFLAVHVWAAWRVHKDGDYEYPLIGKAARGIVFGGGRA